MKYVKDWMTKKAITINKGKSVMDAAKAMKKNRVSSLIVTDKGAPVGILTETDISQKVAATGKSSKDTAVEKIMTGKIVSTGPDDTMRKACSILNKKRLKRLPVIDNGKVVGVFCISDIVKRL